MYICCWFTNWSSWYPIIQHFLGVHVKTTLPSSHIKLTPCVDPDDVASLGKLYQKKWSSSQWSQVRYPLLLLFGFRENFRVIFPRNFLCSLGFQTNKVSYLRCNKNFCSVSNWLFPLCVLWADILSVNSTGWSNWWYIVNCAFFSSIVRELNRFFNVWMSWCLHLVTALCIEPFTLLVVWGGDGVLVCEVCILVMFCYVIVSGGCVRN